MKKLFSIYLLLHSFTGFAAVTETQFNDALKEITSHYENKYSNIVNKFNIIKNWKSDHPNLSVTLNNNEYSLIANGGYARLKGLDIEGFKIALCHEMGHFFAGAPRVQPTGKYSSEGQSDYYAASCFMELIQNKDNKAFLENKVLTPFIIEQCSEKKGNEKYSCERTLLAISKDMEGLRHIPNNNEVFSMEMIDDTIAKHTNFNDYPNYQCRINTLVAGALNKERPRCWYNPKDQEINPEAYDPNQSYQEAMIVGTIETVTQTSYGCHISIDDIEIYMPSRLDPLDEFDIYDYGITVLGTCPYANGGFFSRTLTLFKGKIFTYLKNTDKK